MNFLPTQLGALTALTGNWTQTQLPRKQWCNHYTMNTWFVPSYIWFIAPTLCMVLKHGECKILYYLFWCTWEFQMDSRWWRQVVAAGGGGGTCNSSVDTLELDCEPRTSCSISSTNWTNDSSFAFSSNKSLLCLDVVLQFVHLPTRMRNIYLKYPLHVPLVLILRWMEQIKERHYCMGQIQSQHGLQQNQLKKHLSRPCSEPSFGLDNPLWHASFRGSTERTLKTTQHLQYNIMADKYCIFPL